MLLAGDVGGTKTLIGLFAAGDDRPGAVHAESFRTLDFSDLAALVSEFLRRAGREARDIDGACFGVAGPVNDGRARLTNVPWIVDGDALCRRLPIGHTDVINDLEALAWSVAVLEPAEIEILSEGQPDSEGSAALIAAGTGLGVALLPRAAGRFVPTPSEGGHVDFAARNEREEVLRAALTHEFGRADLEQVLSGPGLVNIYRFVYPHECAATRKTVAEILPAQISRSALEGQCRECRRTLELFVSVYEPLFGIMDQRTDKRIDFVGGGRGLGELERRVATGEVAAAFSLYPTQMDDLIAVADAGGIMPPKSTWFEPKLADGMVSHVLD